MNESYLADLDDPIDRKRIDSRHFSGERCSGFGCLAMSRTGTFMLQVVGLYDRQVTLGFCAPSNDFASSGARTDIMRFEKQFEVRQRPVWASYLI
jgi:hypothetical protein